MKKFLGHFLLSILIFLGVGVFDSLSAVDTPHKITLRQKQIVPSGERLEELQQKAKVAYDVGRYTEAIQTLEIVRQIYQNRQDSLREAMVLNNLALAHQQLGSDVLARGEIEQSLRLIDRLSVSSEQKLLLAQGLEILGKLELTQGKAELALSRWEQAEENYSLIGDREGVIRVEIALSQALQQLGFHRRAIADLKQVRSELEGQPETLANAVLWRSLGNASLSIGELSEARKYINNSLSIAQKLASQEQINQAYISLGNIDRASGNHSQAISDYQEAIDTSPDLLTEVQARLNQLSLLIATNRRYQKELNAIAPLIKKLPANHAANYAKINYAQNLIKSQQNWHQAEKVLQTAIADSQELGDKLAQAYGLNSLGKLYESQKQWQKARKLTEQALIVAQAINAKEIIYQAQWQLGRLLQAQNREATASASTSSAIAAYQQTVETLQSLRADLIAVNPDVQFAFRETIEPIYREYVSLLLQSPEDNADKLGAAVEAIDSLQLAELENFFQAACIDTNPVVIDRLANEQDTNVAIIYPILLEDRFEIIIKSPQQAIKHYSTAVEDREKTLRILERFPQTLAQRNSRETLSLGREIYRWLIEPIAADLANERVQTLVFIPDSFLRNIPMSVLHNGQQYLIEQYAVAISPGLQLSPSAPIAQTELQVLMAGLTKERLGFPSLDYVTEELNKIQTQVAKSARLIDSNFTAANLQQEIGQSSFPVVHLATHGQFSSQAENTFLLFWDRQVNINQLNSLLRENSNFNNEIELLVLSACETLSGDRRAALGLAGMAVRAGAKSTLATLWRVNDEATSQLMSNFYQELSQDSTVSKAQALRKSQLTLLKSDRFKQPHYWGSFVLLGNWL